jgi:hypothetical protein
VVMACEEAFERVADGGEGIGCRPAMACSLSLLPRSSPCFLAAGPRSSPLSHARRFLLPTTSTRLFPAPPVSPPPHLLDRCLESGRVLHRPVAQRRGRLLQRRHRFLDRHACGGGAALAAWRDVSSAGRIQVVEADRCADYVLKFCLAEWLDFSVLVPGGAN